MRKAVFIVVWVIAALLLAAFLSGGVTYFMALLAEGPLEKDSGYMVTVTASAVLVLASIALGVLGFLPGTRLQHRDRK